MLIFHNFREFQPSQCRKLVCIIIQVIDGARSFMGNIGGGVKWFSAPHLGLRSGRALRRGPRH